VADLLSALVSVLGATVVAAISWALLAIAERKQAA
jgi:hypothetical protein